MQDYFYSGNFVVPNLQWEANYAEASERDFVLIQKERLAGRNRKGLRAR